jgi:hypothetical protein
MSTDSVRQEEHHWWERTTWIIGLCLSAIVIGYAVIDFAPVQTRTGNATQVVFIPVLRVSYNLADILPSIAAILGTFFAIAFAFSQFVIPDIAEKYSPRMLRFFRSNWRYRYAYSALFLAVVGVSSLLLLTRFPDAYVQTAIGVVVVSAFTPVLILALVYFAYIYHVVDPLRFYSSVTDQIKASVNDLESVDQGSRALGDSALKALIRGGEDENVEKCIDSLREVAGALIARGQQNADFFDTVFDQLRRIHSAAQRHGDTSISRHTYLTIREIGADLFGKP